MAAGEPVARIPAARRPSLSAMDFIRCHQKLEVLKAGGDAGSCFSACGQMLPALWETSSIQETRLFLSVNQTFYL